MTQLIELGIASRHGERAGCGVSHRQKPGEAMGVTGLLLSGTANLAEKVLGGSFDSCLVMRM